MKKILFIDHQAELGGGEIAILEIIKNLDNNKFCSTVLLGDDGPFADALKGCGIDVVIDRLPGCFRNLERSPGVRTNIFSYFKSAFILPSVSKRTKKLIKEYNADIVYINTIKALTYTAKVSSKLKLKTIWHLHDCLTSDFYKKWIIQSIIRNSKFASSVICVSNAVKTAYMQAKGDGKKAMVVYNGVDTDRFNPKISPEHIKKELGIENKIVVSMCGRLEEWKGQKIFIKTAEIICKKRLGVVFLITGGALFGQEEYKRQLKETAKSLCLGKNILFLGFRNDPQQILSASDIVVHPSTKPEPFGRDIIEAMACGKPVIATDIGAPEEIIDDGKDGFLIKPDNAGVLAGKILDIIDDKEKQKQIVVNARKKIEEKFDIRKIVKQIEEVLDV